MGISDTLDFAVTGTIDPVFGRATYLFSAIADGRVTNSAEFTNEPGVSGRPGAKLARRFEIAVRCFDDGDIQSRTSIAQPGAGRVTLIDMNPLGKESQAEILDRFVNRAVKLSFRTHPVEDITWLIETVTKDDSYNNDNEYALKLSAVEWVGFDRLKPNGFVRLEETDIEELIDTADGNVGDSPVQFNATGTLAVDLRDAGRNTGVRKLAVVDLLGRPGTIAIDGGFPRDQATRRLVAKWADSQTPIRSTPTTAKSKGSVTPDDVFAGIRALMAPEDNTLNPGLPFRFSQLFPSLSLPDDDLRTPHIAHVLVVDLPKTDTLNPGPDAPRSDITVPSVLEMTFDFVGIPITVIFDFKGGPLRVSAFRSEKDPTNSTKSISRGDGPLAYPSTSGTLHFPNFFTYTANSAHPLLLMSIVDSNDPYVAVPLDDKLSFATNPPAIPRTLRLIVADAYPNF
jgi:hypothetical protein